MVNIWPVDMRVVHRAMDVMMVVRESALPFRMLVIVVLVVDMRMSMSHFLMRVAVTVHFQVEQRNASQHQHRGYPVSSRWALSQKRHR